MSDVNFEQMLESSFKNISQGEKIKGTVLSVHPDYIALNLGYKHDGILKKENYSFDETVDLTKEVKVGDELEAIVLKVNDGEGQVALSRKELIADMYNDKIKKWVEDKTILTGKVTNVVKGGLSCIIENGIRVFIPASLVSETFEKNLSKYQDQEIDFTIIEFDPSKNRTIGDRKTLLKKIREEKWNALMSQINEGDIVEGTVKNLADFGAFIDIGGADGLLHVSEISWGKMKNPKKVFNVGDKVKVMIKSINDKKISLTAKFPEDNPWILASVNFERGKVVKGRVERITEYGAFVSLTENIDGLLHISELSYDKIKKVEDVLKVGQEIEVKVLSIDPENKKISLSLKALQEPPAKEQKKEDADIVDVNIEEYGKRLEEEANKQNSETEQK